MQLNGKVDAFFRLARGIGHKRADERKEHAEGDEPHHERRRGLPPLKRAEGEASWDQQPPRKAKG